MWFLVLVLPDILPFKTNFNPAILKLDFTNFNLLGIVIIKSINKSFIKLKNLL